VWPGRATAASRFVKITSPSSSPLIAGTAAGFVARRSERIIDCPVRTIVIAVGCADMAMPAAHTPASRNASCLIDNPAGDFMRGVGLSQNFRTHLTNAMRHED